MIEWRENEKRMQELRDYLAQPITARVASPQVYQQTAKTKEEALAEIDKKHVELENKELELSKETQKWEGYEENFLSISQENQRLLEKLMYQYGGSSYQFEVCYDSHIAISNQLAGGVELIKDGLEKQKRELSEQKEMLYQKRKQINSQLDAEGR
ncbi:hypothetical protein STRDD11_01251 [Streptococcus sp. DD11]|nr:hypothetical protein STRDD11_01251 [Streptococcus sp. DD11]